MLAEEVMRDKRSNNFLDLLLECDIFKDDTDMVDEILTFYFAGSNTQSVTTQNLLMHLALKPEMR